MRTRPKVLLTVLVAMATLFLCLSWFLSQLLIREYLHLERESVRTNVLRTRDAFDSQVENIYTKLGDWSQWDDTYQFINDHNEDYVVSNLNNDTFNILKINLIAIRNDQGQVLYSKYVLDGQELPFPDSLKTLIATDAYFSERVTEGHRGVITLPEGIFMFASRPVTSSDGTAESNGQIFFGYFLREEEQATLSALMHFDVSVVPYDTLISDPKFDDVVGQLSVQDVALPDPEAGAARISGYAVLPDAITGEPTLVLRIDNDRDIFAQGRKSIAVFFGTMAAAAGVIVFVVLGLFEFIVLRKLSRLEAGVVELRSSSKERLFLQRSENKDEFGSLTQEMNETLATLYDTQSRLEEQRNELKKFQLAAEKSFNHLIITDEKGVILYANPAATLNTGYSNSEIVGNTPALWQNQVSERVAQEIWNTVTEEKRSFVGELVNCRKDGSLYTVSANISPILDEHGDVRYLVGIERDITEEKAHQELEHTHLLELEKINQRVTTEKVRAEGILRYLQSIGEGVYATKRDGTVVFCNTVAAALVGKSPEKILGEESEKIFRFYIKFDQEDRDFVPARYIFQDGKAGNFHPQTFFAAQSGSIPVSGSFAPILEQGEVTGAIVVFQNISERYALDQMKDRFLSIAAHQLRTPLGSMRWSMELLEGGDFGRLPSKAKRALAELRKNSDRMMFLINDLLSVSRINQEAVKEKPVPTDIGEILTEVVKLLMPEAQKKKIRIDVHLPKDALPRIQAVKKHLFEAVENLVSNTVRYGRKGGLATFEVSLKDGNLVLSVADNGIGIPKADQSKIFEKFFRASNAATAFTDGSGLGLTVVKSYIEESGGTISFESEEGVGTTFTATFPCS